MEIPRSTQRDVLPTVLAVALGCGALALPILSLIPTIGVPGDGGGRLLIESFVGASFLLVLLAAGLGAATAYGVARRPSAATVLGLPMVAGTAFGMLVGFFLLGSEGAGIGGLALGLLIGGMAGGFFAVPYTLILAVPLGATALSASRPAAASANAKALVAGLWLLGIDALVEAFVGEMPNQRFDRCGGICMEARGVAGPTPLIDPAILHWIVIVGVVAALWMVVRALAGFVRRAVWLRRVERGRHADLRVRRMTENELVGYRSGELGRSPFEPLALRVRDAWPDAVVERVTAGSAPYRSVSSGEVVAFVRLG